MSTPRRRRRALAAACALSLSAVLLAACGDDDGTPEANTTDNPMEIQVDPNAADLIPPAITEDGKIVVGTDATYAPNEFIENGEIVGMDIDLANAIGDVLGVEMEFVNAPFDSILAGVQSGRFELAMSSFTANSERQEVVNFATYFDAGTQWATRSGNPDGVDPDDACGKRVAVQRGTVQVDDLKARSAACTDAGKDPIDIKQYQNQTDATTAVATGKDQAMLADSPVTAYAVKQSGQLELLGDIYDSAPYGVVVPKGDTNYVTGVAAAVQRLIDDGPYMTILEKWGTQDGAIATSVVNPAS